MIVRDLIIGCSTNYDWSILKYWVNSINKATENSKTEVEKVLVLMNASRETVQKVLDSGFRVVCFKQEQNGDLTYSSTVPVHVERFIHIYDVINPKEHRYVITTDVKDVIFQKNPFEQLDEILTENNKSAVFASESMLYKDEPWGNQNLFQTFGPFVYEEFKYNEIYNVGVLAGKSSYLKSLCMNIFEMCQGKPIAICDQSTFNLMISQEPYKTTCYYAKSEEGWAAQLGTTGDPSKSQQFDPLLLEAKPKLSGNVVLTSEGKEFTIVHQYDRVPEMKKVIEQKYS
jgi:hypothetical protein